MIGTLINVGTVLVGGTLGLMLGSRLPERTRETLMNGLGLVTMVIGIQMALSTKNMLYVLGSVLIGGLIGEALRLDDRLQSLAAWLESRVLGKSQDGLFARAFITASLVFCVGPMTILGSFFDGLNGNFELLAAKSILDGFAALAFASSLGFGVLFSIITILIYQGGLTLGAGLLKPLLTDAMITEMTAVGGVLMLAIGLGLLDLKKIRVANLLPGLVIAPVLVELVHRMVG